MHDSLTIANRFLALAEQDDRALTPMQVLKLVYIAHGWRLGLYGRTLIRDEVQAWQYGPVIPRLYDAMRHFRGNPVIGRLPADRNDTVLTGRDESVIDQVHDIYGAMSGPALSRLTHAANTPWERTYRPGAFGLTIPNDLIEDHYDRLSDRAGNVVHP